MPLNAEQICCYIVLQLGRHVQHLLNGFRKPAYLQQVLWLLLGGPTQRCRRNVLASVAALSAVSVCHCGYKAPPSPYFDEQERFSEEISQRSKEMEALRKQRTPSVFLPPDSSTANQEKDAETRKEEGPEQKGKKQ